MLIIIARQRHTRWGVDGQLFINGSHIADTTEHPTAHLSEGIYTITRNRLILCQGNGPLCNTDGSICVGEHLCAGCVIRSCKIYGRLYQRIRKTLERGKTVNLIIKSMAIAILLVLTSCSTARHVAIATAVTHDTLYLASVKYDSIYVDNRQSINRMNDTVYLERIRMEYRYRLLRDTVRESHADTIPVVHEVEVVKTERYIPSVYKWSLGFSIVLLILLIIYVIWKIRF